MSTLLWVGKDFFFHKLVVICLDIIIFIEPVENSVLNNDCASKSFPSSAIPSTNRRNKAKANRKNGFFIDIFQAPRTRFIGTHGAHYHTSKETNNNNKSTTYQNQTRRQKETGNQMKREEKENNNNDDDRNT